MRKSCFARTLNRAVELVGSKKGWTYLEGQTHYLVAPEVRIEYESLRSECIEMVDEFHMQHVDVRRRIVADALFHN
jgi:hypothetical protein